jgi:hypothetical protein
MNQTFSFSRWWMLVIRHWAENRRRYMLSLLAIAGLMAIWNGFNLLMEKDLPMSHRHQLPTYFVGLFLTGCVYASSLFAPLGNKKEAIQYLSVPASQLEKFLCALFYGVFLFFILYNVIFYSLDIPFVNLSRQLAGPNHRHEDFLLPGNGVVNVFVSNARDAGDSEAIRSFLLAFFAIQSMFVLGSIYFTRYAFIKTVVAILLLVVAGALYMIKVISPNIPQGWTLGGFVDWHRYTSDGWEESVNLATWTTSILSFVTKYTLPLIFWYIAYVRLKEKEV